MENFPYLLTLFIVTVTAVMLFAHHTRREAEQDSNNNSPAKLRMAGRRNPAGRVMAAALRERRTRLSGNA